MFCARGPRWRTGRSFVQGSMASQSHSSCVELRSLVRRSSSWRCGSRRWQKKRSCKVCACSPARVRKAGDAGLSGALRHVGPRKGPALRPARDPHHGDLVRRGFQTGQGSGAPGSERGAAGRTSKDLDPLGVPCVPSPTRRMKVCLWNAEGEALSVGTGEALGVHPLGYSWAAFDLAPGAHRWRCWLPT